MGTYPIVRPVPNKMSEEKVDEIWTQIYHDQKADVFTPNKTTFSDGICRLMGNKRLKPDLVIIPSAVSHYFNHFTDRGKNIPYQHYEQVVIVQENKTGNDLHQLKKVIENLDIYQEAASQGVLVDDKKASGKIICVAGSFPSTQSPYFHDHELGIIDNYHYYDEVPEYKRFAIGPIMTGALTVARSFITGKIGFAYFNEYTKRPYIFISPSEGYDIQTGQLDQFKELKTKNKIPLES